MRKKKRSGPNKAFTLIETLLAITIFSFIGLSIAASFFSGIKIWGRATTSDFWRNDIILAFESMAKELRQCIDMPLIGFEGSAKGFYFPTISGNSIVKASYSYDAQNKNIVRAESNLKDIVSESAKAGTAPKDFLALDEFSVQYLFLNKESGKYEWKDEWKKEEGLFVAVRLTGKAHDEEFRKTIFIPVSQ